MGFQFSKKKSRVEIIVKNEKKEKLDLEDD